MPTNKHCIECAASQANLMRSNLMRAKRQTEEGNNIAVTPSSVCRFAHRPHQVQPHQVRTIIQVLVFRATTRAFIDRSFRIKWPSPSLHVFRDPLRRLVLLCDDAIECRVAAKDFSGIQLKIFSAKYHSDILKMHVFLFELTIYWQ